MFTFLFPSGAPGGRLARMRFATVAAIASGQVVNDVHSRMNRTTVAEVVRPQDADELREAVRAAAERRRAVALCGGRHAMGGQQFAAGEVLIDMTAMKRALAFDAARGLITMEAGADWPAVIRATHALQPGDAKPWGIRQKQTGADALTLGGALSANVHGRGLLMGPIVDDVESFTMVTPDGRLVTCSRERNAELFGLAIGGYGLFGAIATVTLRLGPRRKLRRLVDVLDIDDAVGAVRRRVADGCLYGDFQYAIDPADDAFLRRGVFACYKPAADDVALAEENADLHREDWVRLLRLAHSDKRRAFEVYSAHYLASHGRVYWSDTMQLSTYLPTYAQFIHDAGPAAGAPEESLMIGELYVPPDALVEFLGRARLVLRRTGSEDIYGTIRAIRRDTTTFLPWAKAEYACVIFNLRTAHDAAGVARTARTFRMLHDAALGLGGSFYLTYHRYATRGQVEAAYPRFREFLARKRGYDPDERFSSDWYRHYRGVLGA
jgi:FAD/FMN-containing dehydrogenase